MNGWHRGAIVLVVLLLVVGAGIHHDAREESHRSQPTDDELVANYERHVGERTLLFGTVEGVDASGETATIRVEGPEPLRMQVRGFDADVVPGGAVQIYGTLRPGHAIEAENVVVVNRSPGARYYKYAASAVGAFVILVAFFRDWGIDRSTLAFVPRGEDDG